MDPLSAFSIATGVVQFVDFVFRIIRGTSELYHSTSGMLAEHETVEAATLRLTSLTTTLQRPYSASTSSINPTVADKLAVIAKDCEKEALNLIAALKKYKNNTRRWRDSAYKAIHSVLDRRLIEGLRQKLEQHRLDITLHLVVLLREDIELVASTLTQLQAENQTLHRDAQDAIRSVNEHTNEHNKLHKNQVVNFQNVQESVQATQEQIFLDHGQLKTILQGILAAIQRVESRSLTNTELDGIAHQLSKLDIEDNKPRYQQFLDRMYLPILESRHHQIVPAAEKTFEWVLEEIEETGTSNDIYADDQMNVDNTEHLEGQVAKSPKYRSISQWLKSGRGCYWITGKPGSGKSTLMKYLVQHPRTKDYLQEWAGADKLFLADAYFWISGDPRQSTLTGLFRSLFYHLLKENRELIPIVFPWRWSNPLSGEEWVEEEFHNAISILKSSDLQDHKFCFFIDGLDEYSGDRKALAILVRGLSDVQNIKICVSSRPWNEFGIAFRHVPSIRVDKFTEQDIENFVEQSLGLHHYWQQLQSHNRQQAASLCDNIAKDSAGVFLWVFLVVRSLGDGLDNGDNIQELQERLDQMPRDLEKFIQRMLEQLDTRYQEQAKRYLLLMLENERLENHLPLMAYTYVEEDEPFFGESMPMVPMTLELIVNRCKVLERRLASRCRDLIDVPRLQDLLDDIEDLGISEPDFHEPIIQWAFDTRLQFSHRSVRDFLYTAGAKSLLGLSLQAAEGYVPWRFQAVLAMIKGLSDHVFSGDLMVVFAKLFATFESCMLTSVNVEGSNSTNPSTAYLDALDLAARLVMGNVHGSNSDWLHTPGLDEIPRTMIHYAAQYGLHEYLNHRLGDLKDVLALPRRGVSELGDNICLYEYQVQIYTGSYYASYKHIGAIATLVELYDSAFAEHPSDRNMNNERRSIARQIANKAVLEILHATSQHLVSHYGWPIRLFLVAQPYKSIELQWDLWGQYKDQKAYRIKTYIYQQILGSG